MKDPSEAMESISVIAVLFICALGLIVLAGHVLSEGHPPVCSMPIGDE